MINWGSANSDRYVRFVFANEPVHRLRDRETCETGTDLSWTTRLGSSTAREDEMSGSPEIFSSILDAIGETPLVDLSRITAGWMATLSLNSNISTQVSRRKIVMHSR
jgi:hypothetical protein